MSEAEKDKENVSSLKRKHGDKRTVSSRNEGQQHTPKASRVSTSEEDVTAGTSKGAHQNKKRLKPPDSSDKDVSQTKKLKLNDASIGDDSEGKKKKPIRKRMKHTLRVVLDQMEFYFGDSSLSKDRFLKGLVDTSPEGYVDLCVFGNFNKLQTLYKDGVSRKMLIQALSHSSILELNADKTHVRRVTPFKEISQDETNKRTVYVEHLPSHATHMWIKQVFSQCGKVAYVSLPTYKTTKQIKGFAFVEFNTTEGAERACAMLNNPEPDKALEPLGKFPKGNKTLDRLKKVAPPLPTSDNEQPCSNMNDTGTAHPIVKPDADEDTDAETKKKKKKKAKKRKSQDGNSSASATENVTPKLPPAVDGKKKKKKRKRKLSQSKEEVDITDCNKEEIKESEKPQERVAEVPSVDAANTQLQTSQDKSDLEKAVDVKQEGKEIAKNIPTTADSDLSSQLKKRKKKKKKSKSEETVQCPGSVIQELSTQKDDQISQVDVEEKKEKVPNVSSDNSEKRLSHRERKLLRQEDIRRKREQRFSEEAATVDTEIVMPESCNLKAVDKTELPEVLGSDSGTNKAEASQQPTSILKMKKAGEKKHVEFNPVPITTEFVETKGARRRKKQKKEKCHLRVISKKEWLSLKEEYINTQKSHMKALKESLRELRQLENAETKGPKQPVKHLDLEDVFKTKALRLSKEEKIASKEQLKFMPNVIVQWWCTHEMHRDKIRTMFKETHAESIAYIDAAEEARSGYIRFKDETNAEEFAKMSRNSASFMARVLPVEQQEEYWEKANRDRLQKLGRKKKEQGSDRIARKVFERNKATFFHKPSRIVFDDADGEENANDSVSTAGKEDADNSASTICMEDMIERGLIEPDPDK